MAFTLKRINVGPMLNFCYLVGDHQTKQAYLLDPAWEPRKLLEEVETLGFKLAGIVVSHAHYDHTNAVADILKIYDVPVFANREEIPYAQSGFDIVSELGESVKPVRGGDVIDVGQTPLRFLHTPGHTPGSQCVQVGDYLLTGDTLFIGGCGRSDLPGGNEAQLLQSLKKIAELDSCLMVCPGHDYGPVPQRSLEEERKENPYFKAKEKL